MNKFLTSIGRIFQGGARSFARYPASLAGALVIAVAASILIHLDTTGSDKLLHSLQLGFLLAALLCLAFTVLTTTRTTKIWPFIAANLAGLLLGGGVFLWLYLQPGDIRTIDAVRIIAASAVAFWLFLLAISRDSSRSDYNQAAFMVLKSAMIAMIYALVIFLGLTFITFTIKSLLYNDLSEKVYQYLGVWCLFGWFALFLGYFPSFQRDKPDDQLETAQKQPRFIFILFTYVLIPLMTIMAFVLLLWAGRILFAGEWPAFEQLAAIFSVYTLFGIFLMLMVSHDTNPPARWFRRIFPYTALIFLAFEAYALIKQIQVDGLETSSYFVAVLWLYALVCSILFLFLKIPRYRLTAWLAILMTLLVVLPFTGYYELPVRAQASRLQAVLQRNGMFGGGHIAAASGDISDADEYAITRTTEFLLQSENYRPAAWFSDTIDSMTDFKTVYGFQPRYNDGANTGVWTKSHYVELSLPDGVTQISDYQYAIHLSGYQEPGQPVTVVGKQGTYQISLVQSNQNTSPVLVVTRDGSEILRQDMAEFLDTLAERYPDQTSKETSVPYEEMVLSAEQGGIRLLLVFENISINWEEGASRYYNVYLNSIYLSES
ncbi:MAG: DUF4153 domain-containing protein [Clostridiaceae bacterium]|nr:DUF4153 domain-containing protein [Clostridiaceae bacterium]